MTARRVREMILVAAVAAAALAGGCGETGFIPVAPVEPALEGAPDPFFRVLLPVSGGRTQTDAVAVNDSLFYIAGTAGLLLQKEGDAPWRRLDTGTDRDLLAIVADGAGALAVGSSGAVFAIDGGTVRPEDSGVSKHLRAVVVGSGEAWAVGDGGTVVRRDPSGAWSPVACPVGNDLAGAALFGDTLRVCGGGGTLLRRVGGEWTDESDGPWERSEVAGVASFADGSCFVLADSLYQRAGSSWRSMGGLSPIFGAWTGLKQKDGFLWMESEGRILRAGWEDEAWRIRWCSHFGDRPAIAPIAGERALGVAAAGGIRWFETVYYYEDDPWGLPSSPAFLQLDDGTVGCFAGEALFLLEPGGLVPADPGLLAGIDPDDVRVAAGPSLDDFYVGEWRRVSRLQQGQVTREITLPETMTSVGSIVVEPDGQVLIGSTLAVYEWPGDEINLVLGDPETRARWEMKRGGAGSLLAYGDSGSWIRRDGVWVELTDRPWAICGETPSGDVLLLEFGNFYDGNDYYRVWRPGADVTDQRTLALIPGAGDLTLRAVVDSPLGIHLVTDDPARVFRMEGEAAEGRWECAAGPYPYRLEETIVLPDGSLLVYDSENDHILLRRPH